MFNMNFIQFNSIHNHIFDYVRLCLTKFNHLQKTLLSLKAELQKFLDRKKFSSSFFFRLRFLWCIIFEFQRFVLRIY